MQKNFKLEDFFLKIFKGTVFLLMTLAALAMFAMLASAAYNLTEKPVQIAPARKAPDRNVTLDDLKKELLKDAAPTPPTAPAVPTQPQMPPTLKYLEDVTLLYRCSTDFARKVGAEIEETDNAVVARRVEDLRAQTEALANEKATRGERWVKSAVQFTCAALADAEIIAWRKEGKVKSVFFPILNYHLKQWDRIVAEKEKFEKDEADRVQRETAQEELRIAAARALALSRLMAAGIAFGIFMALALYLILAKIELNLRNIDRSILGFQGSPSGPTP